MCDAAAGKGEDLSHKANSPSRGTLGNVVPTAPHPSPPPAPLSQLAALSLSELPVIRALVPASRKSGVYRCTSRRVLIGAGGCVISVTPLPPDTGSAMGAPAWSRRHATPPTPPLDQVSVPSRLPETAQLACLPLAILLTALCKQGRLNKHRHDTTGSASGSQTRGSLATAPYHSPATTTLRP